MIHSTTSVWILGDQLLKNHPALTHALHTSPQGEITVVLVESEQRFARHRYHQKKVILLKSAMRHYAERLKQRGYRVDYRLASPCGAFGVSPRFS